MSLLIAILFATVVEVRVTTVDGVARDAALLAVTETGIEIESSGVKQRLEMDELLTVTRFNPPPSSSPAMRVELSSGSRIAISELTTNNANATLITRNQAPLTLPLKQIRWIRFRPASPGVDPQWLGMIDKPRTSDVLVIRRSGNSLDEVQGIVKSITDKVVTVDLDGDDLLAPIEKLEGVLFATPATPDEPEPIIVDDLSGSSWRVVGIKPSAATAILLDLGNGLQHELPLDQLRRIETTGSVQFLAMETPAESSYAAVTGLGLNADLANRWFGAQSDASRDLVMQADSRMEYRVDEQFNTLLGSAQFDSSVTAGGKCLLRILLDEKVAWEQTFDVEDPAPRGYELPLEKARRVRIEVQSAGDGDLGDTLRIRQPRLVK